jgi:Arc/MetJ-type ribon-helix-helix transcriptional regulator
MASTKLTVSVPDELACDARLAVREGRAASVSGYVAAALEHYRRAQTLDEWLDQVDAELGPPSADAVAWAESMLTVRRSGQQPA